MAPLKLARLVIVRRRIRGCRGADGGRGGRLEAPDDPAARVADHAALHAALGIALEDEPMAVGLGHGVQAIGGIVLEAPAHATRHLQPRRTAPRVPAPSGPKPGARW